MADAMGTEGIGGRGNQTRSPTHFLIYDVETRDFRGRTSDGVLIVVNEHVFAERVRALAHKLATMQGGSYVNVPAYRGFHSTAIHMLSNADAWRGTSNGTLQN